MPYYFTSESVSEGHPDKIADQISDAILDNFLAWDANSKIACETLVTTGQVILAGEVKSRAYVDVQEIARNVIKETGYTHSSYMFDSESCGILSALHEQSPDINRGVTQQNKEEQGAGDQGIMFGYASNETENYMPLGLDLAHKILIVLADIRKITKEIKYLRPDAKSQVTILYDDDNTPLAIDNIVISTQHDEFILPENNSTEAIADAEKKMQQQIQEDICQILIPKVKAMLPEKTQLLFTEDIKYHINPTGKFVIGGPHGDSGLTGRKIIVDTYGGKGGHGGGAFSGKDPSKVDRSAAYAARYIAKNLVAAGVAEEVLVQLSYAIGVAQPTSVFVNTYGKSKVSLTDGEIGNTIKQNFDLRPGMIEDQFQLRNPIYSETAAYGHMGRKPSKMLKTFTRKDNNGKEETKEIEVNLFAWEKLDAVEKLKKLFKIESTSISA